MALWTFAAISTDLWLDANESISRTIVAGLSNWADKKANGLAVAQATTVSQPAIIPAGLNGLDLIRFDGSNDFLSGGDILDTGTDSFAIFALAKFSTFPTITAIVAKSRYGVSAGGRYALYNAGSTVAGVIDTSSDGSAIATAQFAFSNTGYHLFCQIVDRPNGSNKLYIDGVLVATSTFTANSFNQNSVNRFLVGAYPNSTDSGQQGYFNGDICELCVLKYLPSDPFRWSAEGYLLWKWGLQANLPAAHLYKSAAPTITDNYLSVFLFQPFSILGDYLNVSSEQLYGIVNNLGVSCEQLYSMVMEIWLTQHYGGVPIIGKSLVQPYGNGSVLIRSLQQRWDHAPELEVSLEQPWSLPDLLQAVCTQSYGIVAEVLHLTCEQLYHINELSTLFASLLQPYIIAEETVRLYQFDTRLYIDDERIPYHALEWQAVDSEFVWSCDFSVKTRAVAEKCVDGAEITIVSAGDTWRLKCCDGWFLDKRFQSTVYRISGRSRSWDLSLATPLLGDIAGGMASEIVAALAAPHGISVDWQMVDGYIADGKITANDQAPIEIIKDIVHDAGGIVLSTLDGNLLIVAEEETPVPDWSATTPAQVIHAVLERISTSESKDEQKGYNCFDVSDQLASGETFRFEEERIDGRTKELRLFLVPLDPARRFVVTHSSDHQVTAEPFGIVSLQISDELVEFKEGSGQTSKPVHGLSSVVWQKENLGGVTYSEDGILTSAVSGYSLLKVSYVTKFFKWIARDPRIEDVQFRAEEVTA